jgi:hypothetical protein
MSAEASPWQVADPFDLPDWLGEHELTWRTDSSLGDAQAPGTLCGTAKRVEGERTADLCLSLAVLGADTAFPLPVVSEPVRTQVHQAWTYGQVALLAGAGSSLAIGVPATSIDIDLVCEALRRFAKAIGVEPHQISLHIRL